MNTDSGLLDRVFSDLGLFSKGVLGMALYDYQLGPMRAVARSVLRGQGLEFLLVFPRQSGKNEAVAHLLVYLMNLLQRKGGQMVFGATGDGLGRGIARLESRLENVLNAGRWRKRSRPIRRELGRASVVFMSTHPAAAARGETAHWLLVIDEMQDQAGQHLEAVFEPMRAANNATALYIGTVKSTSDALWLKRQELEEEETRDGRRRVYVVPPEAVMAENASYGRFLARKVGRLGRRHPIVASEYYNEPLGGESRLFDERRLALMRGDHHRRRPGVAVRAAGDERPVLVATLDVGGQDEAATDPVARLANPARDYTAAHIFSLIAPEEGEPGPKYLAQDVWVDQGSRHFQDAPGRPRLADRLLAWIQGWGCAHLVADASGVGAGLVDWLAARLRADRVTPYLFSPAAKASLGSAFLAVLETGRFRYWTADDEPLGDGWWFFTEAAACTYWLPPDGRFERDLRWGVAAGMRVDTPLGPRPVHDDRLISAALVSVYDRLWRQGRLRLGQARSAVVPPRDPLGELSFED